MAKLIYIPPNPINPSSSENTANKKHPIKKKRKKTTNQKDASSEFFHSHRKVLLLSVAKATWKWLDVKNLSSFQLEEFCYLTNILDLGTILFSSPPQKMNTSWKFQKFNGYFLLFI